MTIREITRELAALYADADDPLEGAGAQDRLAALLGDLTLQSLKQLYPAMDLRTAQRGLAQARGDAPG